MRNRVLIGIINALVVLVALLTAFMLVIGGIFASDSGTTLAMTVSYAVILLTLLYAVFTVWMTIRSQRTRSLITALLPLIVPALFFGWLMSPFFSFS